MTTYKQIVSLDWYSVQNLCIEHDWYTHGTCGQFLNLQDKVAIIDLMPNEKDVIWALQNIAEDIKDHSETEYEVSDIMTALSLKCRRWFIAA